MCGGWWYLDTQRPSFGIVFLAVGSDYRLFTGRSRTDGRRFICVFPEERVTLDGSGARGVRTAGPVHAFIRSCCLASHEPPLRCSCQHRVEKRLLRRRKIGVATPSRPRRCKDAKSMPHDNGLRNDGNPPIPHPRRLRGMRTPDSVGTYYPIHPARRAKYMTRGLRTARPRHNLRVRHTCRHPTTTTPARLRPVNTNSVNEHSVFEVVFTEDQRTRENTWHDIKCYPKYYYPIGGVLT